MLNLKKVVVSKYPTASEIEMVDDVLFGRELRAAFGRIYRILLAAL